MSKVMQTNTIAIRPIEICVVSYYFINGEDVAYFLREPTSDELYEFFKKEYGWTKADIDEEIEESEYKDIKDLLSIHIEPIHDI